jgi:hypothetical protein
VTKAVPYAAGVAVSPIPIAAILPLLRSRSVAGNVLPGLLRSALFVREGLAGP